MALLTMSTDEFLPRPPPESEAKSGTLTSCGKDYTQGEKLAISVMAKGNTERIGPDWPDALSGVLRHNKKVLLLALHGSLP